MIGASRAFMAACLLVVAGFAGGCRSFVVTPAAVRAADAPEEVRAEVLDAWRESVALANQFLASPFRRTLPPGRFELDDDGMRFVTGAGTWPIEVRNTWWGDVVLWSGGRAQEAGYGFCVGKRGPPERDWDDDAIAHSFFWGSDGELYSTKSMTRLILHETTHVVYRHGTVGFGSSLAYYLELFFLFRGATSSHERRPRGTGEEFTYWHEATHGEPEDYREIARNVFLEHVDGGEEHANCRHGPFDDAAEPPLPPRR